jgi:hypothetical protein
MKKWLRKSFVVMISILTFGLVTPSHFVNHVNASKQAKSGVLEANVQAGNVEQAEAPSEESTFNEQHFVESLLKQAEIQSYQKFGTKIKPVIENEFREVIFPKIVTALEETSAQYPKEDLVNLAITERPGGGYSEKIFNVKNEKSNLDVLRFHVRREKPPQSGYWFNFHYHTYHDDFQSHHEMGTIYWDKNTPPKWMC